MEALLTALHAVESVALAVLIWRTIVADREREAMREQLSEVLDYFRAVIDHFLGRTDLK